MRWPHVDKEESTYWFIFANASISQCVSQLCLCYSVYHLHLFFCVFFLKVPLKMCQPKKKTDASTCIPWILRSEKREAAIEPFEIGWLSQFQSVVYLISCLRVMFSLSSEFKQVKYFSEPQIWNECVCKQLVNEFVIQCIKFWITCLEWVESPFNKLLGSLSGEGPGFCFSFYKELYPRAASGKSKP